MTAIIKNICWRHNGELVDMLMCRWHNHETSNEEDARMNSCIYDEVIFKFTLNDFI